MISPHLSLVMMSCFLGAAMATEDASFLQLSSDLQSSEQEEDDVMSQHMYSLYERCSKAGRLKEGNTVRSFRANRDFSDHKILYLLNLTTLRDSEVPLSASFHFLLDRRTHQRPWLCKGLKRSACHTKPLHTSPSITLLFRYLFSDSEARSGSDEAFLSNLTFRPHRRGVWQTKDVTSVIKEARHRGQLLLSVELSFWHQRLQKKLEPIPSFGRMSYLILYADDRALAEPNSVASSLQRFDPFGDGGDLLNRANSPPFTFQGRPRREANEVPDPVQDNELPGINHWSVPFRKEELWNSDWYLALKPKSKSERKEKRKSHNQLVQDRSEPQLTEGEASPGVKASNSAAEEKHGQMVSNDKRRKNERRGTRVDAKSRKGSASAQSPVLLSFDEQTMRRARRRQWGGSQRGCARRNLKVDFADIGWSDWIIAPKAFEAYYCAGMCGFPLPQVTRPSNHATIQSIVRAVGIIPGVPEPCCVPENMNPVAVLFHDEAHNQVLKVYPSMSVQSCSCR